MANLFNILKFQDHHTVAPFKDSLSDAFFARGTRIIGYGLTWAQTTDWLRTNDCLPIDEFKALVFENEEPEGGRAWQPNKRSQEASRTLYDASTNDPRPIY